jgi:hypothetical protein
MILKRIMKKYDRPKSIITDGHCSHPAALKEVGMADRHVIGRRLNNRAESGPGASAMGLNDPSGAIASAVLITASVGANKLDGPIVLLAILRIPRQKRFSRYNHSMIWLTNLPGSGASSRAQRSTRAWRSIASGSVMLKAASISLDQMNVLGEASAHLGQERAWKWIRGGKLRGNQRNKSVTKRTLPGLHTQWRSEQYQTGMLSGAIAA